MSFYKNGILTGALALIFFFSIGTGFFLGRHVYQADSRPVEIIMPVLNLLKPKVTAETKVYQEKAYLCGDMEKISEGYASGELLHMDKKALREKFPAAEGWTIVFTNPDMLSLTLKTEEFCPVHRKFRHIGIYHGLVAVYEGPLGYNDKILCVENIMVESLHPDYRIKLEQAMDLPKQSDITAEGLRAELEFASDETLHAVLENMDEHV